ncbi:MAG: potassium channel family protein [Desulfobacterales bacterium]|nr:potassium channel family protein [Desulfobacterales bacterium]
MHALRLRLKISLIIFFAVMVFGSLGIMIAEGRSFFDAFYFVIVTMATVGYGDIHPVTTSGKLFAILIIIMGVGAFLGVIANTTELMLNRKIQQTTLQKLNIVVGVFFSEVGARLIAIFTRHDPDWERFRKDLVVTGDWNAQDFLRVGRDIKKYDYEVVAEQDDLEELSRFFLAKRGFLVGLLENPLLMEHAAFTDLLRAVFHLAEELAVRENFSDMPVPDKKHIAMDIKRAYGLLVDQWLVYMKHLKDNYPYLFSLAMRVNPFLQEPSPVVTS